MEVWDGETDAVTVAEEDKDIEDDNVTELDAVNVGLADGVYVLEDVCVGVYVPDGVYVLDGVCVDVYVPDGLYVGVYVLVGVVDDVNVLDGV